MTATPSSSRDSAEKAAKLAGRHPVRHRVAVGGRTADPWIGPDILVVLREKKAQGFTDVVSCPIGFVSDHLEVLFDIDIEAQGVAHEIGLNLVRTKSLNADEDFVRILAEVVHDLAS